MRRPASPAWRNKIGIPLATPYADRTWAGATEVAVVNGVDGSSGMQYAVIAGLRTETGLERFVIAYPNEESLRDLIAASSLIAVGFCSREQAVAGSSANRQAAFSHQQTSELRADRMKRYEEDINGPASRRERTSSTMRRQERQKQ